MNNFEAVYIYIFADFQSVKKTNDDGHILFPTKPTIQLLRATNLYVALMPT